MPFFIRNHGPDTGVRRGFVVRAYLENNHSVIATQRAFRIHFGGIPRAESVPSANSIELWIRHLVETESTLSRLGHGAPRTVRTPENVQLSSHQDAQPGNTL